MVRRHRRACTLEGDHRAEVPRAIFAQVAGLIARVREATLATAATVTVAWGLLSAGPPLPPVAPPLSSSGTRLSTVDVAGVGRNGPHIPTPSRWP